MQTMIKHMIYLTDEQLLLDQKGLFVLKFFSSQAKLILNLKEFISTLMIL